MEQFALAVIICSLLAIFMKKISFSPIPAYIILGLILGKSGLNFFGEDEISKILGEIGLIFLLFYIGLELKYDNLKREAPKITASGLVDLFVNFVIGFLAAFAMGFDLKESFVIASAFYISSSAIVIHSLIENRKLIFPEAETIIWLMIFEDIVLIFLIFFISAESNGIALMFMKTLAFVFAVYLIIKLFAEYINRILSREDETPLLFVFSLVVFFSFLAKNIHVPEALAAISLGAAMSGLNTKRIEELSRPFKDVFIVLFFFFFGVSVEIGYITIGSILIVLLAIFGKFLSGIIIGRISHNSIYSGVEIGASTVARGEFSIVLASIFGSEEISALIAFLVLSTAIIGTITAKYSTKMRKYLRKIVKRTKIK